MLLSICVSMVALRSMFILIFTGKEMLQPTTTWAKVAALLVFALSDLFIIALSARYLIDGGL